MFPFLLVLGWICLAVSWSDRLKRIFETLNNLVLVLHYRTIDSSRKPVVWCGCTVTVAERTKWPPVAALVRLVCLVVRCCIAAQSQLIKRLRIDNSSAHIPLNSYLGTMARQALKQHFYCFPNTATLANFCWNSKTKTLSSTSMKFQLSGRNFSEKTLDS